VQFGKNIMCRNLGKKIKLLFASIIDACKTELENAKERKNNRGGKHFHVQYT
jgi:hypothetical protein